MVVCVSNHGVGSHDEGSNSVRYQGSTSRMRIFGIGVIRASSRHGTTAMPGKFG